MSKRMKVAFGCHLLALLMIAFGGTLYLSRTQFMSYHAVALGKSWTDIDQPLQTLFLAGLKAGGGANLAIALAIGILLFIPFRQGLFWARWAIPVVGLASQMPVLYATLSVTLNTPATPPWIAVLFTIVLLIAGLVLSMERSIYQGRTTPLSVAE